MLVAVRAHQTGHLAVVPAGHAQRAHLVDEITLETEAACVADLDKVTVARDLRVTEFVRHLGDVTVDAHLTVE